MKNKLVAYVRATASDLPQIFQLQRVTWLDTYPNTEHTISIEDIQSKFENLRLEEIKRWNSRYLTRINNVNTFFILAFYDETVVGYCEANINSFEHRIFGIYVLPEYQKMGTGSGLILQALDWLGTKKAIYVNVASYNERAIKFYQKHGFKKTGKSVLDPAGILNSGAIIPEIELIKSSKQVSHN